MFITKIDPSTGLSSQESIFNMSTLIFGVDPESLVEEWAQEGLEPTYGSIENDLMVQKWEEFHEPAVEFKKEGLYHRFKPVVHSRRISGTFYRYPDEHEHFEHLQPGDQIDYRSVMTRWENRHRKAFPCVLKLTCEGVPGLSMEEEIILGESLLTVVSREGGLIEVRL